MKTRSIVAGKPFLIPNPHGRTSCLLIHGFTSWPEEMRWLGADLARRGHTVLAVRLPGHGTTPADLRRVHAADWLAAVADGIAFLQDMADVVFLAGLSLGGALALIAASEFSVDGVVAMAAPYEATSVRSRAHALVRTIFPTWKRYPDAALHPELGSRRQVVYPAYAAYPTRVERQLVHVQMLLHEALPKVDAPVLVVHSTDDPIVEPVCADRIHRCLGSDHKRLLWLDGFGHSVVRAARRQELFEEIAGFFGEQTAT